MVKILRHTQFVPDLLFSPVMFEAQSDFCFAALPASVLLYLWIAPNVPVNKRSFHWIDEADLVVHPAS